MLFVGGQSFELVGRGYVTATECFADCPFASTPHLNFTFTVAESGDLTGVFALAMVGLAIVQRRSIMTPSSRSTRLRHVPVYAERVFTFRKRFG
jgi:hypothetical protein